MASALNMPFDAASFDAAITFHVAMNIRDRQGLYAEIARVLRPGALFCIYDVVKGGTEGLDYPVPWAETADTSFLTTVDEMRTLLGDAFFKLNESDDRTAFGIDFFRERLAATAGVTPPLGLHLLMGRDARRKFKNVLSGLERGCIAAMLMLARR